jgi:hypothetical protein
LTEVGRRVNIFRVQVIIDIPEELAEQLDGQREQLVEIIARGLRRSWSSASGLRREVVAFLAGRPTAEEIIQFRPSAEAADRGRELLHRNQQSSLSPEEEAELDEICELDRFVSLIKAEVLLQNAGRT